MPARCQCPHPQVFDHGGTCVKCGRCPVPVNPTPTDMQTALFIAEIAVRERYYGKRNEPRT